MTHETKHTPGPWVAQPTVDSTCHNIFGTSKNQEYHIGTLQGGSRADVQIAKANARLIAAAPELLEALQYCLEAANAYEAKALYSGNLHEIVQEKARAAIAKARGQQ